jgi:hypothetical protein
MIEFKGEIMDSFHLSWLFLIVLGIVVQIAMLVLQVQAAGRYTHISFRRLRTGTALALVACLIYAVPYFTKLKLPQLAALNWAGMPVIVAGAIFGVWGTASLFRHYGELFASRQNPSRDE